MLLQAEQLTKIYQSDKGAVYKALDEFSIAIEEGEFVGIMGPSGSGKTTLLNILATIDIPTSGSIALHGQELTTLSKRKLSLFRRRQLGFVFQDFNLIETLTIEENIALPLVLDGIAVKDIEDRVQEVAVELGIQSILKKRTYEISGGQQQRVSIARAMIHEPSLILADEPTGNLDSKSSTSVMHSFSQMHEHKKTTMLMVTHDPFCASYCQCIIIIKDGKPYTELHKGNNQQAFFQKVLDTMSLLGGHMNDIATIHT
ncbi:ABC transporter ATP-binding protein [Longirhabdus pacifica]|uniref:ABC transporter ATP-binding protein n=1 Tax=Longirhabdus pacifica TaxID=2305227 RepID=UPI001008C3D4|nr:ABC transporter ATP-binding protein [Longirhabdus pacifica]